MDISLEDDDCAVEAVTPAKKKKMKQAQLPFQISSASKSPNSTNTMSNKKKRKVISPSVESKNSKLIKLTVKENSVPNICERENVGEEKLNSSDEIEILTLDEEKKNLEQSDQQSDGKKIKSDTTPKRTLLGKNKKLDRSQQKSGALTKFLKKIDKETESDCSHELKDKQNQNTFVSEEENEICLNESLGTQTTESTLQNLSQENKQLKDTKIVSKDSDHSFCQKSDCDITILSSDNEDSSELDKSILNEGENEEIINKPATPVTPKTDKIAKKIKLTPKQLEKRQEIARKREEKLRLKKEKDKKREEEKEQKKKERELKELKKQMEIEQKQKEKEAKEEERRKREEAKEEEKRKKEEEKLEAQRKKQKAASNFASFFVPKKQEVKSEEESVIQVKNFMPFEIKADMRIAPICRRVLTEEEKSLLDRKRNLDVQKSELYLEDIKKGRITPHTSSKTWPLEAKDDDIVLLDEDNDGSSNIISDNTRNLEKHRPKLLQFSENRRPPYWGTWRKRSNILNPRRPFAKEKNLFDYEIDSDDEWEEEEPGESLKGSDDEKDEENPEDNEYDVDNEFMVPHGYLSEEEAQADEEEVEDMSPQTQKMKLKILGEQFEAERNTKTYKLKPKIIGCIWQGSDNSFPESVSAKVKEFLTARQAWISNTPIVVLPSISSEEDILAGPECKTPTQQSVRGPKKTKFPDEALPDLIRLLHGNTHSRRFLMKEFITFWSKNGGSQLSKVSVLSKINEVANKMACPEEGPMHLKSCWYISEDIRNQYLPDEKLLLPNSWTYILTPSRKSDTQDISIDKAEKEEKEKEKEKKHIPLITQFTKKITQEEMKKQLTKSVQEETKKQLTAKPDQISAPSKLPPLQRLPKRATLLSVGRGEQFPEKSRENMLANFIGLNKSKEEEASSSEKMIADSDDVLFVESIDMKKVDQKNDKS